MPNLVPIAITILSCHGQYLFIKRRKAPYEGLWSMVGGKVGLGEHIQEAAIREVKEETGASEVTEYSYRGFVSERLVQSDGVLLAHFLIFINHAKITDFQPGHREGDLALFSIDEIKSCQDEFLPSDWFMFKAFHQPTALAQMYEAELVQDATGYKLNYYRKVSD